MCSGRENTITETKVFSAVSYQNIVGWVNFQLVMKFNLKYLTLQVLISQSFGWHINGHNSSANRGRDLFKSPKDVENLIVSIKKLGSFGF